MCFDVRCQPYRSHVTLGPIFSRDPRESAFDGNIVRGEVKDFLQMHLIVPLPLIALPLCPQRRSCHFFSMPRAVSWLNTSPLRAVTP